jgi:hypothetical protein
MADKGFLPAPPAIAGAAKPVMAARTPGIGKLPSIAPSAGLNHAFREIHPRHRFNAARRPSGTYRQRSFCVSPVCPGMALFRGRVTHEEFFEVRILFMKNRKFLDFYSNYDILNKIWYF